MTAGLLQKKDLKGVGQKSWKTVWGVLSEGSLYFFKEVSWFQAVSDVLPHQKLEFAKGERPKTEQHISANGLISVYDTNYTKHEHAIHVYSLDGPICILLATDGMITLANLLGERLHYTRVDRQIQLYCSACHLRSPP